MIPTHLEDIIKEIKASRFSAALKKIDRAIRLRKGEQILFQLKGEALRKSGDDKASAEAYKQGAVIGGKHTAACWYNAGVQYQKLLQFNDAIQAYKNAVQTESNHASVRNNLCVLLYQRNRVEEALEHAKWILNLSNNVDHLINAGYVLRAAGFDSYADQAFSKGLKIEPDNWKMISAALQSSQYTCNWERLDELETRYKNEIYNPEKFDESRELHHVHIAWCDDESLNFRMAKAATKRLLGNINQKYFHEGHKVGNKIKIGYVSSDFFNHATLHLLIGVLENHNKDRFEIYAYCHSRDDSSSYRKRFLRSIDHFYDISKLSDDQAAEQIYKDKIDILFDLKGFTDKNRLAIFARKPAPIQVTYIGFPGTSGAKFFDYTITDKVITPDSSKPFYTEKLCRMPEAYQCNDSHRLIASNQMTRSDYGLPDDKFVFCCFNQSYKIDRLFFTAWIEILKNVPNSVLWILDSGEDALSRFRALFENSGVDSSRLIIAEKEPPPIHLERIHNFADLALDTRIVNGHTTTSDALWASVPVVTLYGKHFNSRVSSSLLTAVGLEQLITGSVEEYIQKAIRLANDPDEYRRVKDQLKANLFVKPLFDTKRFTKHFEAGLERMVENYKLGCVDHIDIDALPPRVAPIMSKINSEKVKAAPRNTIERLEIITELFDTNNICNVCNSENSKVVRPSKISVTVNQNMNDVASNWHMCADCGHVFRNRILNVRGVASLTERPQSTEQNRIELFDKLSKIHAAIDANRPQNEIKVLQVYPENHRFHATGLEFGYVMSAVVQNDQLEEFKKLGGGVIAHDFLKMNIQGTPDAIHFGQVIEKATYPKTLLLRALNMLDEGGLVTFEFSNHASLEWFELNSSNECKTWDNPLKNNIYKMSHVIKMMKELGFDKSFAVPLQGVEAGIFICFSKKSLVHEST